MWSLFMIWSLQDANETIAMSFVTFYSCFLSKTWFSFLITCAFSWLSLSNLRCSYKWQMLKDYVTKRKVGAFCICCVLKLVVRMFCMLFQVLSYSRTRMFFLWMWMHACVCACLFTLMFFRMQTQEIAMPILTFGMLPPWGMQFLCGMKQSAVILCSCLATSWYLHFQVFVMFVAKYSLVIRG